jgi:hypothetical protein
MRFIMSPKVSSILIYALTAAAISAFVLMALRDLQSPKWYVFLLIWFFVFGLPLVFVYAYPRFLFARPQEKKHHVFVILLNILGAAITLFFFLRLSLPDSNSAERFGESLAVLIFPLIALPVFLVAALSLLFRNRSSLATLASVLLWPHFLFSSLVTLDRFFNENALHTAFYFLCFVSPALWVFAAGAVSYRPTLAHAIAVCAGLFGLPWIYWTVARISHLGNPWLWLNLPDYEMGTVQLLHLRVGLFIFAPAVIMLAISTAMLRMLPPQWQFRKLPLSNHTWPACVVVFLFLALWFWQSVMPYRIPGAMDYSDWPILQILHVEKRGLQFHESSVSVYRGDRLHAARNDRRLFQYRFEEKRSEGKLPKDLAQRIQAMVQAPVFAKRDSTVIKPLRAWNAEGWYLLIEGSGIHPYTTEKGTAPPQEVISLFHDLEATPLSAENQSDRKDICLGFCYDPLAGLGYLYSNHRCFDDTHGTRCR